jgi:S-DNA-T family DNA segregation ATPase FtsK/SpoIIIE
VHRRGGLGVFVLVLAVVVGAGVWAGAGGPVGQTFSSALAAIVGLGAVVVPVLLFVVGVVLMTTEAHPEARPRLVVGSALLALAALGLVHIGAGLPAEPERWHEGGGAVGYLAAVPLASGLTVWVAVPVARVPGPQVTVARRGGTSTTPPGETRGTAARGRRTRRPGPAPPEPPAAGCLRRAARRGRAARGTRHPVGRDRRAAGPTPPSRPAGPGHPARRDGRR